MITSLELVNYRNYERVSLHVQPGIHLVTGPNAQGKTNLLEAIALLSTGRILRGQREAEAIREGEQSAMVRATISPADTEIRVNLTLGARRRATLNSVTLPRMSDLLGRLPTITFSNLDLSIIRGDASCRRAFLDEELSQIFPAYLRHLTTYKRALEQRNALLKTHFDQRPSRQQYEVWEEQLTQHGAAIREARKQFAEAHETSAKAIQAQLTGDELLSVEYLQNDTGNLEESFQEDSRRGTTTVGPHRDDLRVLINGRDSRNFGSMGQQRTAAIALKMSTMDYLRKHLAQPPTILLDDVLSELDENRRARLIEWVSESAEQTFITCNEPEQAGPNIINKAVILRIKEGKVIQE